MRTKINPLTTLHLKRYSSMIYSIKELIQAQKIDGYDHMIDTLLVAMYGIEDIITDLEQIQREEFIRQEQSIR